MRKHEFAVRALQLVAIVAMAYRPAVARQGGDDVSVAGPGGQIVFTLHPGEQRYQVSFRGESAVALSRMGLRVDGVDLGRGAHLEDVGWYSADETFPWWGVHSAAVNRFNGARMNLRHAESGTAYVLDVRVFDDGVAFRHVIPGDGVRVPDEATSFRIPDGSRVWFHDFGGHYEGSHVERLASDVPVGDWAAPPLTIELPNGLGYASITEAGLSRFAGMGLQATGRSEFAARLGHEHPPSYPFVLRYGEDEAQRLSAPASIDGEIATPWRVILIAADLNGLVNSDIIRAVSPPPDPALFPDGLQTSWLKPGRTVWQYLDGGEKTLEGMKEFSRLAGELGFEYNLIEGFWQNWSKAELRELVDYSREYGVGIWLWKHSRDLRTPEARREFFGTISSAGVVGAKVDFFDHEAKEVIDVYEDLLREAAAHQIMLNFHGANKPAGEARTWPNEMNREGISGMERRSMPAWSKHNATLPFTRMLAGHADFTPMLFGERRRETSWAHQIASAAILSAPALVYGAHPQAILDNPAVDVIKHIPGVWDETIVLPMSEIGVVAAFARRHAEDWFVAVVNGPDGRTIDVPLEFLGGGIFDAALVRDDPNEPAAVRVGEASLGEDDSLKIEMRPGGGFVARLRRADHE